MWRRFLPFLIWLPEVGPKTLAADAMAGLIGALVVLPQGVAFAIIAGMPPEYGLYVAMIPAAIAALFGSSRIMVSGPATPASIVLFSTLSTMAEPGSVSYVNLALTLTLMVGMIQLAMGLARLGNLVNFISDSVVVGFSAGAALLIALSQTRDFLGIDLPRGLGPHEVIFSTFERVSQIDWMTVEVGLVTILVGLMSRRLMPRVPYMVVALLAGSGVALLLKYFGVADVALVSAPTSALPPLSSPVFSASVWQQLAPAALAVTVFTLSQAVSIARNLAARSGDLVDGNQEFIGQGLSNIAGAFFSGYVSTGSFNRSGVNLAAGAVTPLASVFTAILLVGAVAAVAPLLAYMPKAATAGVLFIVAVGIVDVRQIRAILRASRSDSVVLIVTFLATILLSLDFAIVLGVMASLAIYLNKASRPRLRISVPDPRRPKRQFSADPDLPECPQLRIIGIDGSLFFGASNYVTERLRDFLSSNPGQKHLLILGRSIGFIDVAGAEVLARENRQRQALGGSMYLHQFPDGAKRVLRNGGYAAQIGEDHFFESKGDAIAVVIDGLDKNICAHCTKRIFNECKTLPRAEEEREP